MALLPMVTTVLAQQLAIYDFESSSLPRETLESFTSSLAQEVYSSAGGYGVSFRGDMERFVEAYKTFLKTGSYPGPIKGVNYALLGRIEAGAPYIERVSLWKKVKKGKGKKEFEREKRKLILSGYRIVEEKAPENETASWEIKYIRGIIAHYYSDVYISLYLVKISDFRVLKKESYDLKVKVATIKADVSENLPSGEELNEESHRKIASALGEAGRKTGKRIARRWLEPIIGKVERLNGKFIVKAVPTDVKTFKRVVLRNSGTIEGYGELTLEGSEKGWLIYRITVKKGKAREGDEVILFTPDHREFVSRLEATRIKTPPHLKPSQERIFRVNYEKFPPFFHSYTLSVNPLWQPRTLSFEINGGVIVPTNTGWDSCSNFPVGLNGKISFLRMGENSTITSMGLSLLTVKDGPGFGKFSMAEIGINWGTSPETIAELVKNFSEESSTFRLRGTRKPIQKDSEDDGTEYLSLGATLRYIMPFLGDAGVRLQISLSASYFYLSDPEKNYAGFMLLTGGGLMWW